MEENRIEDKAVEFLEKFFQNEKWNTFAEDFQDDCIEIFKAGFKAGMPVGEAKANRKETANEIPK